MAQLGVVRRLARTLHPSIAMETPFRFTDVRTTQLAWAAMVCAGVGWALDAVTGPLWVRFGIHAGVLETLGTGLWWFAYAVLWLLLPVSAFRPENRFYTQGDCLLRVKRFALILSLLAVMHLLIAVSVAFAFRGGW
jgi:hypothetical protein